MLIALLTALTAGYHLVPAAYDKGHETSQPAEKLSVTMAKTLAKDGKVSVGVLPRLPESTSLTLPPFTSFSPSC